MANFTRIGFGQVEPNQLSAIKTGQIYASLPLSTDVNVLQNGEFMFYNYAENAVTGTDTNGTAPEPYVVYNEIKIYEDWLSYKDFAMIRVGDNYVTNPAMIGRLTSENADGTIYGGGANTIGASVGTPTTPGDIVITPGYQNPEDYQATIGHVEYPYRMDGIAPRLLKTNVGDIFTTNMVKTGVEYSVGTPLGLEPTDRNTMELSPDGDTSLMKWVVVKVYTMPDGQPGLKIQRIA